MIDFELKQNARTADLGYATDKKCEKCGCVSSAYLEITTKEYRRVRPRKGPSKVYPDEKASIICKGCLLEGVNIIDKGILEQTKTKV